MWNELWNEQLRIQLRTHHLQKTLDCLDKPSGNYIEITIEKIEIKKKQTLVTSHPVPV
jgi:hypothetical protein